jgi:hypothetical protein
LNVDLPRLVLSPLDLSQAWSVNKRDERRIESSPCGRSAHNKKEKKKKQQGLFIQARKSKSIGGDQNFTEKEVSKPLIDCFYQVKENESTPKKKCKNFLNLSLPGLRLVSSSLLLELAELPGLHRLYASNQVPFPIRFISSVS